MKIILSKVIIGIGLVASAILLMGKDVLAQDQSVITHLVIKNSLDKDREKVPVTWGVPLGVEDEVYDLSMVDILVDDEPIPAQFTSMARWGAAPDDTDAPVAWLLVDILVDLAAGQSLELDLVRLPRSDSESQLRILEETNSAIRISTGAAIYTLSKIDFNLFDEVETSDGSTYGSNGGILFNGNPVTGAANIKVEHQGINRISLLVKGGIEDELEYTLRLHFYKNLAVVKAQFRLENLSAPAQDENGAPLCYDYGSVGSISFDDLTIVVSGLGTGHYSRPLGEFGENGVEEGDYSNEITVIQESAGDDHWNNLQSEFPRLQSGVLKRASTILVDGNASDGPNRLGGWLDADGVLVAVNHFWQNFPKALRAGDGNVQIALFPGEYSIDHQLRAGEYKTHEFWIAHHPGDMDCGRFAESLLDKPRFIFETKRLSESFAAGPLAGVNYDEFEDYENGIDRQLAPSPDWTSSGYPWKSLYDSLWTHQEFGWVDWGDVPVDFEAVADGIAASYNLKYDALKGLIQQALRKADDDGWYELAEAGATHAADIDILHSRTRGRNAERYWFEGGIYGHLQHDERGNTNPHRNQLYPNLEMHGTPPGMFLWAWLTGDTLVLDSALEAAENTYWRTIKSEYLDSGECADGLRECDPSQWNCNGWNDFQPNRVGGHVMKTMMAAYLSTGIADYIELNRRAAEYMNCFEKNFPLPYVECDRYNMQTIYIHSLGAYILMLSKLGLAPDNNAEEILSRRMEYMTGTLWDDENQEFRMCYDPDYLDLQPFHDNWLLSVADAFGAGGLVLNRPELIEDYGHKCFLDGSANQFFQGSGISYHSAKEYVNQIGYGQLYLYAYEHLENAGDDDDNDDDNDDNDDDNDDDAAPGSDDDDDSGGCCG